MKRNNATSFISIVSLLFVFLTPAFADDFYAEVMPSEINPGDAFRIKIILDPSREEIKDSGFPTARLNNNPLHFGSCGKSCFVAIGALGVETKPGVYTIRVDVGGKREQLKLLVRPAAFPEIHLTLPEEKVFLSPENLKRAQRESKKLKEIWMRISGKLWEGRFIMPLENSFSTAFGTKRIMNKEKVSVHRGLDIRGEKGEEIKASNRGRVVMAEEFFFGGNTIILDHGQGIYTIYMHLSGFNVQTGAIVSKEDIVGYVGSTGRASGPHLHFGVKVTNINTNPDAFTKLGL
jgi:murein DD-endopeptidase MepM/ murein hydrolase activator NlpD